MQRWSSDDLAQVLPVSVTRDSQAKFVLLTLNQYNQLVRKALSSHDSQAKTVVQAPELDGDGGIVPDYY